MTENNGVKPISVVIRGQGGNHNVHEIEVARGTTPADVKRELSVPQSWGMLRYANQEPIPEGTDLHQACGANEKVEVSDAATLG